jgi:hypothetical protein
MTVELSVAIATDRLTWVLTDDSTFTSPLRTACGVFVQAYKLDYENNATELDAVGDDEDPETDSAWTIDYTADGAYKVYYVSIPDFNSSSSYDIYEAVFQPSSNKVFRSKQNSNTEDDLENTTWWEEITEPATLAANKDTASESTNIDSLIYLRVFSANGQYEYANQLSSENPREQDDNDAAFREYNIFAKMLDEVAVADSRSEVLSGELICRRMQSRFIDN